MLKYFEKNFGLYALKHQVRTSIKNAPRDKALTKQTIKLFQNIHGLCYTTILKQIKPILQDLRKYDEVILFENQKIYKHAYLVLFQIWQYQKIIDFYNSEEYKESFAGLKGDKRKFLKKYRKFRKEIYDIYTVFPGSKRLKSVLFKSYVKEREFIDIFLSFYTLYPLHQFKIGEPHIRIILEKTWFYFSSTPIHSEDVIYKSLAIVLNGYFRHRMSMKSEYSVRLTKDILYELFRYDFEATSADLLRKVYIGGRIDGKPIFKNRAKGEINSQDVIDKYNYFFHNVLSKDFPEVDFKALEINTKKIFEEYPLTAYFNLYPREFLQPVK